jgi:hypothetical protein
MMSVRAEEAERLAEILRDIFALSKTKQPNHSQQSAVADDSTKSVDTQCGNRIQRTDARPAKQGSDERSETED